MFVELERARLTRILAEMEEKAGKIKEAAEILQETTVRTGVYVCRLPFRTGRVMRCSLVRNVRLKLLEP